VQLGLAEQPYLTITCGVVNVEKESDLTTKTLGQTVQLYVFDYTASTKYLYNDVT
jgi:hypothetical protein